MDVKEAGRLGGIARKENLSPKQLSKIGKLAVEAKIAQTTAQERSEMSERSWVTRRENGWLAQRERDVEAAREKNAEADHD